MPVHVYELVSHFTRQATVDFVSMYSLIHYIAFMSLLGTGLSREGEINETGELG